MGNSINLNCSNHIFLQFIINLLRSRKNRKRKFHLINQFYRLISILVANHFRGHPEITSQRDSFGFTFRETYTDPDFRCP